MAQGPSSQLATLPQQIIASGQDKNLQYILKMQKQGKQNSSIDSNFHSHQQARGTAKIPLIQSQQQRPSIPRGQKLSPEKGGALPWA